jgi:hypothetical protein
MLLATHIRKGMRYPNPWSPIDEGIFCHDRGQAKECGNRQPIDTRSVIVSETTVADATSRIYESLQADNADIDVHIATLKAALAQAGLKEAVFDPARLMQNNRSGRKLMQAYFRQRGVTVKFSAP